MFGVNPVIEIGLAAPLWVKETGVLLTVYEVTGPPGGVNETIIVVEFDAVPETEVGAVGGESFFLIGFTAKELNTPITLNGIIINNHIFISAIKEVVFYWYLFILIKNMDGIREFHDSG